MYFVDRVLESSTTTGTGNFTLAGAVTGYQSFNTAFGTGSAPMFYYVIVAVDSGNQPTGDWEVGRGHLSSATALVRDSILASTNANAAVDFAAGTKRVFADLPAYNITQSYKTSVASGMSSVSASAFAFKGNILVPSQDLDVYALYAGWRSDGPIAGTYSACIAPCGSGSTPSITSVPTISAGLSLSPPASTTAIAYTTRHPFTNPVRLVSGSSYALMIGRTDSTTTFALPLLTINAGSPQLPSLLANHTFQARIASVAPANGNALDTSTGAYAAFHVGLDWAVV